MLALMASLAWGGGYFYSDSGIVAASRGGAFVAGADNQFAQYYNPAGLIRIDAPTVNIGLSLIQQNISFDRMLPEPEEGFYPTVENQAKPFKVPEIGFATPLGERMGFAFGFYSPFAPSSDYEEEGPQRYTIKRTQIYQFSVGPSLAVALHENITVGFGLQWKYLQLGEELDITIGGDDNPNGDIAVKAEVYDKFTANVNFGALLEEGPVSIGLGIQPPTKFAARGDGTLSFEGSVIDLLLNESEYTDEVLLNIGLPLVVRLGVAVRPIDNLEIEVAAVHQGWSSLEDIRIQEIDIEVDSDSPLLPEDQRKVDEEIVLPAGLRNTSSFRLGVEYQPIPELALRAGGFRENSALGIDEVSVALVDTNKWQIGGGIGLELLPHGKTGIRQLVIDASGAILIFEDLIIRESTVTQIDAGVFDTVEPSVVGNGDIRSDGWLMGASASWRFGGAARKSARQ